MLARFELCLNSSRTGPSQNCGSQIDLLHCHRRPKAPMTTGMSKQCANASSIGGSDESDSSLNSFCCEIPPEPRFNEVPWMAGSARRQHFLSIHRNVSLAASLRYLIGETEARIGRSSCKIIVTEKRSVIPRNCLCSGSSSAQRPIRPGRLGAVACSTSSPFDL